MTYLSKAISGGNSFSEKRIDKCLASLRHSNFTMQLKGNVYKRIYPSKIQDMKVVTIDIVGGEE